MTGRTRGRRAATAAELEVFRSLVKDPAAWMKVAISLVRSGEELDKIHADPRNRGTLVHVYLIRPMQLVVAFSIENALKAVLASRDMIELEPDGRLRFECKPHDLLCLCDQLERASCGIELSLGERESLARLTEAGTWAARYPSPMSPDALADAWHLSFSPSREVALSRRILEDCKRLVEG